MTTRLLALIVCTMLASGCSMSNLVADDDTPEADQSEEAEEEKEYKPYNENGVPGEAGVNPTLEASALEWAQNQDAGAFDSTVDYRWATLRSDWSVVRDDYGDIQSKESSVWVGGPVVEEGQYGDGRVGDCTYRVVMLSKPYEGGDQYGSARMNWKKMRTYFKLHCEDAELLAQATPEGQEPGEVVEMPEAEAEEAEEANDGASEGDAAGAEEESSE